MCPLVLSQFEFYAAYHDAEGRQVLPPGDRVSSRRDRQTDERTVTGPMLYRFQTSSNFKERSCNFITYIISSDLHSTDLISSEVSDSEYAVK